MYNTPIKNMGSYYGTDDYRSKKIVQAPGGSTSISLGFDTSSPFEHKAARYLKKTQSDNDNGYQSNYAQTQKISQNKFFTGAPFATDSQQNQFEPKSTFNSFGGSRNSRNPITHNDDKFQNRNFNELLQKSLQDSPTFKSQKAALEAQSPMEVAYLKHKVGEEAYKPSNEPREAIKGYSFQSGPPSETSARSQLRSRSQANTLQNNYRNIINDFSSPKSSVQQNYESPYSGQFRTTNDFAESKSQWSGKKIVQPPGGGSSLKLWG